jgi:hypothetical protein
MTFACAACGGGTGPRTRRRWPRRAVKTGSNRTVVPPSSHVLVLCPHHVSVAVTAQPARPQNIRTDGAGSRLSPSLVWRFWYRSEHIMAVGR